MHFSSGFLGLSSGFPLAFHRISLGGISVLLTLLLLTQKLKEWHATQPFWVAVWKCNTALAISCCPPPECSLPIPAVPSFSSKTSSSTAGTNIFAGKFPTSPWCALRKSPIPGPRLQPPVGPRDLRKPPKRLPSTSRPVSLVALLRRRPPVALRALRPSLNRPTRFDLASSCRDAAFPPCQVSYNRFLDLGKELASINVFRQRGGFS